VHQYFVGDDQVPSVTQVTGVMSKPALRRWYGNTVADYFKNRLSPGMELDEIIIEEIYKDSKSAPFKTRDKAGDLGTLVHAEIENYLEAIIRGGKYETSLVNQKARSAYERFIGWWVESGYTPIATETMIYHREFNYAGTFDILAEDADGRTVVLDIKTSKGVYDEHFAQMAAYAMALWDGCLPQFEIKAFPSTAVVHVPVATEKLAIKTSKNDIDTDCEGFIAMRQLYKWSKGL
jgi:genome maintenance exonuclease 1